MDNYTPVPKVYGSDSFRDGVLTPGAQALVTGILSGVALGAILWLLKVESAWRYSLALIPVTWFLVWLLSLSHWRGSLEKILGRDIDNDGYIGEPPPQRYEPVRVELIQDGGRHVDYLDLPAKPEQLRALADGLSAGRQFSLSAWSGAGKAFSRSEFEALRSALLARGLARWRNPESQAQGIELLASGRAILRQFSSDTHSPTLRER